MRIFIAGIMQGSREDKDICEQSYRRTITEAILARYPAVEIVDPFALHPDSVDYNLDDGRRTFFEMNVLAAEVDLLIAYAPEASMGTAIEMWQAYQAGVPVLTISPMAENWVVQFLSARVFPTMADFTDFVVAGGLDEFM
ncbi:MAG: hypothetical protein NUW24_03530 [Anaerolineae bacterium]|jgi:hypothetical protein|nr:hypothetical protein [Anaerolineae bacterium]MDH7473566.1 hypothetical protein [Anaerolineae bacterium]